MTGKKQISKMSPGQHSAFIYSGLEEQLKVTTTFFSEGLKKGEQCIFVACPETQSLIKERLDSQGIDPVENARNEDLRFFLPENTYMSDGIFNQEKVLRSYRKILDDSKLMGYKTIRISAETDWLQECDYENVIEYERMVNVIIHSLGIIALCQYSLSIFPYSFIKDIMLSHPYVIYDDFKRYYSSRLN